MDNHQIEQLLLARQQELMGGTTLDRLRKLLFHHGVEPADLTNTLRTLLGSVLARCIACGRVYPASTELCPFCWIPLRAFQRLLKEKCGIQAVMSRTLTVEATEALRSLAGAQFVEYDFLYRHLGLTPRLFEINETKWKNEIKPRLVEPDGPWNNPSGCFKATEWRTESNDIVIVLVAFYWPI